MTSKSYVSGSHANWENIQLDSFTGWINQHLHERGLAVKDLSTDFSDGVLLINLLEVISGKKVSRYVRNPKFLQHKIDNIMVALTFMEKMLDIKVVGLNAKDIVDGNLKQIMGVSFLLIQKVKSTQEIDPSLAAAASTGATPTGTPTKRATLLGTPLSVNKFVTKLQQSAAATAAENAELKVADTRATIGPSTIDTSGSIGVSTLRNRFVSVPPAPLSASLPAHAASPVSHAPPPIQHSQSTSALVSDVKTDRGLVRKTKSGVLLCGTFEFGGKQHNLRKLVIVQAHIRGWLARRRVRAALEKHHQRLKYYEEHFAKNPKAYRGLCKAQARTKGKMERKRLWRQHPLFRRNDIVKEILSTERKYVKCLEILIEVYLRECEKILQPNQVKSIFSQIEVIKNVNYNLLTQMENRFKEGSKQQLGEIFKRTTDYLKVYTNYVNNYNTSIAMISECKLENERFAKLLETNRIAEKCMGLDLSAFLIMPIQRLPRYVLLLQDLVKNTADNHPDFDNLNVALKKMKDVAEYVNEKKREAENLNQVLNIQHSLVGKFDNLAEPHRRYVRKGPLSCLEEKSKMYFFFLFNDILLKTENRNLTKQLSMSKNPRGTLTGADEGKFKFIITYHLDGASLIDLADPSNPFSFQLIGITTNTNTDLGQSVGTTAITLTASSLGEKMIWINDIDESISQLLEKTRSKKRSLITDYDELTTATYEGPIKDAEMSGILIKQHTEILWKQKQFYLKNGNLYYNTIIESEKPKKMKCINLILSSVKLVQVVNHPHCFQLITPLRIYFFSCADGQTLFLWISLIRSSIAKKIDSLSDIEENPFLAEPSNQICADCGAHDPSWVSTSFGVVLCVDCSGVHRHLPNGASKIKSLRGLSMSNLDIDHLKTLDGNAKANSKYEKNVPNHLQRPAPRDGIDIRLPWIYAKYLPNVAIPSSPSEVRRASVKMGQASPSTPVLSASLSGTFKLDHSMELKRPVEQPASTPSPQPTPTPAPTPATTNNNNATTPSSESLSISSNSNSVISTPNSLSSVEVDKNSELPNPSASPALLSHTSSSADISSPESLTPISSTTTSASVENNSNGSTTSSSVPGSPATANMSGTGSWRGGAPQMPSVERKKSIFLDKPRKEIKKEIDGILYKTSSPSKSSNWKKYHFYYKEGMLNYFKLDDKKMKKPRGVIDLSEFYSLKVEPKPKQQYSFTLITKYRLFFFACETIEDLKSWVEVLSVESKGVSYQ